MSPERFVKGESERTHFVVNEVRCPNSPLVLARC